MGHRAKGREHPPSSLGDYGAASSAFVPLLEGLRRGTEGGGIAGRTQRAADSRQQAANRRGARRKAKEGRYSGCRDDGCAFGPHSLEVVGVQGKETVNLRFLSCPCNQGVIGDAP
jgi:hypothetical protein